MSLRGGPSESFYIHIQNYRKTNRWVWHTIQQGVKYGLIPNKQIGQPEVAGNIFDWCMPKRAEELVVILYVDTLDLPLLEQTLNSLVSQDMEDWGLIVVNNTGFPNFLSTFRSKNWKLKECATFIDFEKPLAYNEAVYKAIHYYLNDQDSFVCLLRQGDVLLYSGVLSESMNRLNIYSADVLIGKEISKRTLINAGLSRSDFIHPRQNPETLSNGLVFFRKYLFDALSHLDMKEKIKNPKQHLPGYSKITLTYHWLNDVTNISILTPIIELSQNPIRFDHFNVLRTRPLNKSQINAAKKFVKTKESIAEGKWERGRKTFLPNQNKIELDITYDCNLKCHHCNRSCSQAPSKSQISLDQIYQFVKESVSIGKKWELINIMGGEPTLHPQFEAIVDYLLREYVDRWSPETTLQITSNGYGDEVIRKLKALPTHANLVINKNSFKNNRIIDYFTPFNLAPLDEKSEFQNDYQKGCWVTSYCGIGLNHLGYFACGVAGGIERVIESNQAIASLAELSEQLLQQQLNYFCRYCGNYNAYSFNNGDFMERAEKDASPKIAISNTWKKLYGKYKNERT